jgi:hypothetical protein
MTVVASEPFGAEVPGRVLAGDLDVGVALFPEPMRGVQNRPLRAEPLALVLGKDHHLASADPVPVASLAGETLLMFPRRLAPGYYDRVVAACEQHVFQPDIRSFADPRIKRAPLSRPGRPTSTNVAPSRPESAPRSQACPVLQPCRLSGRPATSIPARQIRSSDPHTSAVRGSPAFASSGGAGSRVTKLGIETEVVG